MIRKMLYTIDALCSHNPFTIYILINKNIHQLIYHFLIIKYMRVYTCTQKVCLFQSRQGRERKGEVERRHYGKCKISRTDKISSYERLVQDSLLPEPARSIRQTFSEERPGAVFDTNDLNAKLTEQNLRPCNIPIHMADQSLIVFVAPFQNL